MDSLKKLNEKIKSELHLKEEFDETLPTEDSVDFSEPEEIENEEEFKKESKARIRLETETRIKGIIKNLEFDINFRDLADRANDEIDGIVLTREKAHQIFNLVRDMLGF